eukprot:TRINITY_DN6803_c0_g1_i1.p1 TRINITY_DN6803_c0_g1~~TRINITY_DN6803_c0_g1_i1.p1  ORF type:complete len:276 (+),score=14.93 TRINITY_DN6803_c0_g1_i1:22-849(+)
MTTASENPSMILSVSDPEIVIENDSDTLQPNAQINNTLIHQTRQNMLFNLRESFSGSTVVFFFKQILDGSRAVAIVSTFIFTWGDPCDQPIRIVLFLQAFLYLLSIPTNIFNKPLQSLNFLNLLTFILMNCYFYTSESCRETSPSIYRLTLTLLIIEYILNGLPCLCICLICLSLPCLFSLLRVFPLHKSGASQEDIKSILLVGYHELPHSEEDKNCTICLLDFETKDMVRCLPCEHFFHEKCVDEWLSISNSCPLCREPPIKQGIGINAENITA